MRTEKRRYHEAMKERATIVVIGEFRLGFRFDSGGFRFFGEFRFGRSLARRRWLG